MNESLNDVSHCEWLSWMHPKMAERNYYSRWQKSTECMTMMTVIVGSFCCWKCPGPSQQQKHRAYAGVPCRLIWQRTGWKSRLLACKCCSSEDQAYISILNFDGVSAEFAISFVSLNSFFTCLLFCLQTVLTNDFSSMARVVLFVSLFALPIALGWSASIGGIAGFVSHLIAPRKCIHSCWSLAWRFCIARSCWRIAKDSRIRIYIFVEKERK